MSLPDDLDDRARAKWGEILPGLPDRDQGTLDALRIYCSTWATWLEAESRIRAEGAVVRTPQGLIASPWVGIAKAAQVALRQWAGELRLTPRTRRAGKSAPTDPALRALRRA